MFVEMALRDKLHEKFHSVAAPLVTVQQLRCHQSQLQPRNLYFYTK